MRDKVGLRQKVGPFPKRKRPRRSPWECQVQLVVKQAMKLDGRRREASVTRRSRGKMTQ
jgi:hypothetical protein